MTECTCNAGAAINPALETLRGKFWEYCQGWLSEKDFKAVVVEYSQILHATRTAPLVADESLSRRSAHGAIHR